MNSSAHQPDLPQSAPAIRGSESPDELARQVTALRLLLNLALAAVLVFSMAINLFLWKQMRLVRSKVRESQPVVQRMAAEFTKKEQNMRSFVGTLQSYALAHPDFYSVLSKYTNAMPQYFVNPVRIGRSPTGNVIPPAPAPQSAKPVGR
jgi:hypothetical protein